MRTETHTHFYWNYWWHLPELWNCFKMWTQISNIISRLGIFQDAIKKCLYKEKTEEEGSGGGEMMTRLKISRICLFFFHLNSVDFFRPEQKPPPNLPLETEVNNFLPNLLHFESDWDIFCCLWQSWVLTQFLSVLRCTVGRFTHLTRYKESIYSQRKYQILVLKPHSSR